MSRVKHPMLRLSHIDINQQTGTVYGLSLPLAARDSFRLLTACHKEAKASLPLQLIGAYRLRNTTLAKRIAASRNY